jgi:hypothetical protein
MSYILSESENSDGIREKVPTAGFGPATSGLAGTALYPLSYVGNSEAPAGANSMAFLKNRSSGEKLVTKLRGGSRNRTDQRRLDRAHRRTCCPRIS